MKMVKEGVLYIGMTKEGRATLYVKGCEMGLRETTSISYSSYKPKDTSFLAC